MWKSMLVVAALALTPFLALAQQAPSVGYAYPPSGRAGTTVAVRLGGYEFTPDVRFHFHNPRVKIEATGPVSEQLMPGPPYWFGPKAMQASLPIPREAPVRITLPADLPPGPIRWQASTATGISNCGIFLVTDDDSAEVLEDEARKEAQVLPALPVAVSGRMLKYEEIDRYRFKATKTGLVTCTLSARRLGSNIHAIVSVTDAAGRVVADAADTQGHDAVLTFAATAGAEYTLALHDVDYRGDRSFVYRLTLAHAPRVLGALPSGGQRSTTRTVELIGLGLATGQNEVESIRREVTFPADPSASTFTFRFGTPAGPASWTFPLSDTAEQMKVMEDDPRVRRLVLPAAITGRFSPGSREDIFTFAAEAGETLDFAAEALCIGSPLDLALAVVGPNGKELLRVEDTPGTTDAHLSFTAPAAGGYTLVVQDSSSQSDKREGIYRLTASRQTPGFKLETNVAFAAVLPGVPTNVQVKVIREGGFKEPITLKAVNLPPGVHLTGNLTVPAGAASHNLVLKADADAPAEATLAQIVGAARIGGEWRSATASALITGNLAPRTPEDNRAACLSVATIMKPPFKLIPIEKDGSRRVHRGATHPAELIVERTDGFTGELLIRMASQQSYQIMGITGPEMTIPAAAKSVIYPIFMPEWLETRRTSRMNCTGLVRLPDGKGKPRWLAQVAAGQIAMHIEGALLKVVPPPGELQVRPGADLLLPLTLARSPKLTEDVRIELIAPPELSAAIKADPVVVTNAIGQAVLTVRTTASPAMRGIQPLTIRATALKEGKYLVLTETVIEVEMLGQN